MTADFTKSTILVKDTIIKLIKLLGTYVMLLIIFYYTPDANLRFFGVSFVFICCILLFNIDLYTTIFYIIFAICSALTESIYVIFFKETWTYKAADILSIPYWIIPIWGVAIVYISELTIMFRGA